jgi:hypothetical protein
MLRLDDENPPLLHAFRHDVTKSSHFLMVNLERSRKWEEIYAPIDKTTEAIDEEVKHLRSQRFWNDDAGKLSTIRENSDDDGDNHG